MISNTTAAPPAPLAPPTPPALLAPPAPLAPLAPPAPPEPPALPSSRPAMAPTNITFRVNTNGRFYVYEHHWQREKEPIVGPDGKPIPMGTVDPNTCCYVAGDFNGWAGFFWEEGWDPSSEPYRMYDHDGDGIYEATVEVPAPPTDAVLLSADQPTPEQLESQGWRVLNSTAYYTWKVAGLNWGQQETIGMHEPLPEDDSCLLGPKWDGAPTASNAALTYVNNV